MSGQATARIFISYSRADSDFVNRRHLEGSQK
jgi:hypothetical protein